MRAVAQKPDHSADYKRNPVRALVAACTLERDILSQIAAHFSQQFFGFFVIRQSDFGRLFVIFSEKFVCGFVFWGHVVCLRFKCFGRKRSARMSAQLLSLTGMPSVGFYERTVFRLTETDMDRPPGICFRIRAKYLCFSAKLN